LIYEFQIHAQSWRLHSVNGPHEFWDQWKLLHESDTEFFPSQQGLGIVALTVWTELGIDDK
jgi:hypothetical protein